jgi:hypothetical protein
MRKLVLVLFFVMGLLGSRSASAQLATCDGCVVAAVQAGVFTISTGMQTLEGKLELSNQSLFGQLASSNSAAIIGAEQAGANAAQQQQAEFSKNALNMKYEVAPTACTNAAMTQGVSEVARGAPVFDSAGGGGGVPAAAAKQPNASYDSLIAVDKGLAARPTPEVSAQTEAKGGCLGYASTADMRGQSCQMAGFNPAGATYVNADIAAETLIDGPQNPSNPEKMLTIKQNTPEYAAIEAYLHNLNQPIEMRDLTKTELATNAGVRYMALHDIYQSRMSLASKPSRDWIGNMTADPRLVNVVNQMIQNDPGNGSAKFVQNYLTAHYPNWQSDGISMTELLNMEGERRYLNGDWYNAIASAAPDAVAREQAMMSAAGNYLTTQLLLETRQTNIYLGQILASTVRQEYQGQLLAAHKAATN